MPSAVKGSSSSSGAPTHPTHAPPRRCMTGTIAVTRPPGLRRHEPSPSSSITRSTGSRLATTTNSLFVDAPTPLFLPKSDYSIPLEHVSRSVSHRQDAGRFTPPCGGARISLRCEDVRPSLGDDYGKGPANPHKGSPP